MREGGIVVRKVVSMVRDTLTGLNDLLEIAAEQDLLPSRRFKRQKSARETSSRDDSPVFTPAASSPTLQAPPRAQVHREASDIMRLDEELRLMKAEVAQLKEHKARDNPVEQDHVRIMRSELDALREQVRSLKEARLPTSQRSDVQGMRDEITSLKNEIHALQSDSRGSSIIPSIPSTPNRSNRFSDHNPVQATHPLAHLLAAGSDPIPQTLNIPSNAIQSRTESEAETNGLNDGASSQAEISPPTPRSPVQFEDISLPVKSKRKARMIFSKG